MQLETRLNQSLGVNQQLNLAPQLLQWLKLLQLPTAELYSVVQQELEINPTLEIDENAQNAEELSPSDGEIISPTQDDTPAVADLAEMPLEEKFDILSEMDYDWSTEANDFTQPSEEQEEKHQFMLNSITAATTLQEHLIGQLQAGRFSERQQALARFIIGSLDQRGYLTESVETLAEMAQAAPDEIEETLRLVQSFDPPGVGARDLRECLLLQLDDKVSLPARIIADYLDALGSRQYAEIAAALQVSEAEVMEALQAIRRLQPEPGKLFAAERTHYITPDVVIRRDGLDFIIELNDRYIPPLRVTPHYQELLTEGKLAANDKAYLRKKMRASSFLIQGIRQRQETLRKVAAAILRHQREFFESVDGMLKPLTMAQVAKEINVHETTVSRALANKHMETPRGLFEMKYFFCAGYQCTDGSGVIPDEVKEMINRMVAEEPPARPLTDLDIARRMQAHGIKLARRTVAKYREELGIASSKERQFLRRRPKMRVTSAAGNAVSPLTETAAETPHMAAVAAVVPA